jgi:hypothetical protein
MFQTDKPDKPDKRPKKYSPPSRKREMKKITSFNIYDNTITHTTLIGNKFQ